jgi:hypothetical protein
MTKRRPSLSADQLAFTFDAPMAAVEEGALRDLERQVSSAVGTILTMHPGSRFEVAGGVSALLDTDVSKSMLDAYSAEAKDTHNISVARFLALVVVTQRFDVLDAILRQIGCGVLVGEEIHLAELGHIMAQERALKQRRRQLETITQPLKRGARR